jgi:hypothetical protein
MFAEELAWHLRLGSPERADAETVDKSAIVSTKIVREYDKMISFAGGGLDRN